ncbi:acyl-CoA thioesterase [Sphingobium sp.]|uniref:acyl-CoA thioesterase n=1 Tax=Sphingobium sp. TaxID=1912891 RepID=UPI0028BD6E8E|nr:thioesterase family protein [Sphingobium sp.]
MNDASEHLISTDPLIVRRRVSWGECDPAGVVYTPRFAEYVVSAMDYWFKHVLQHSDRPHPLRKQVVYPMRAMSFDFTGMLEPDDQFDIEVRLANISTRTLTLAVEARHEKKRRQAFSASLTVVAYDQEKKAAVPIPEELRCQLRRIQAEQNG